MHWYQTSLGKKYIMAVTGLGMVCFVIVHMIGNLTIYAGPNAINSYAEKLHLLVPLLWGYRVVMLALVLAHICTGAILYLENRRARPTGYQCKRNVKTSFPAETMIWTGLLLGVFIVYHLLHFTVRVTNPDISNLLDSLGRPNVFAMVALSFARTSISAAYVFGMAILLLHLFHGIQSIFQSLGLNSAVILPVFEKCGRVIAFALMLGFASIPVVFLFGILKF
ncbi:MAG TPA: succinate dehydrogenase cytochrome b subunit [Geobacteraceae bacterium]|nr:succinate dehydrogenase cytochrome b subunit [Geobacteraceae bacterium]